ncbi:hypothetical protein [Streptomyces sp. NPDC058308]|uniref:hypothetical protein n=1 Tax=Streptomyces sp. NPDC058308 TaxID=3346440 RepID=UPI0036E9F671
MSDQPSSGPLASTLLSTPFWSLGAAGLVLGALVLLSVLVLAITRRVVDKARPEDLPEILHGLGHVLASLACFLPWGKTRENTTSELPRSQNEAPEASVTIVAGQLAAPAINLRAPSGEGDR